MSRVPAAGLGSQARSRSGEPGRGSRRDSLLSGSVQAAPAGRCGYPERRRGREGAPSPHTVEETLAGSVQARALPAARGEHFRGKKSKI